MPRVNVEQIVEEFDSEFLKAIAEAAREVFPDTPFDEKELFRRFSLALGRRVGTLEIVSDSAVEFD